MIAFKSPTIALTVGFFDGVHLGHRALFKRLKELGHAVCVTFENHPQEILSPTNVPPLLTPHKVRLAQIEPHVDTLLVLPFSREMANLSPQEFIAFIRESIPFTHLLLGYDGRLGKGRAGTPEVLRDIGNKEGFEVEYLEPLVLLPAKDADASETNLRQLINSGRADRAGWGPSQFGEDAPHTPESRGANSTDWEGFQAARDDQSELINGLNLRARAPGGDIPVSSGRIRQVIKEGDLESAERLLGCPFAITGEVIAGPQAGRKIGFPTANLDPGTQVVPPFGVYAVTAKHNETEYRGVANLGVAPTLHTGRRALLEVHLFDTDRELYGEELTVSLHTFIREERTFASVDELKAQIQRDIQAARADVQNREATLR